MCIKTNEAAILELDIIPSTVKGGKIKQKILTTLVAIFFLVGIAGCGGYYGGHYMVKGPSTGNIYYTDSIDKVKGGAIKFKDAKTKTIVTVQNSEVKKISKNEYESALEAKEAPETKEVK